MERAGGVKAFQENYPELAIKYIVDSKAVSEENCSYKKPQRLLKEDKENIFIIVTTWNYYDEIKAQLEDMGFNERTHFMSFKCLIPSPSAMMIRMFNAKSTTGWRCDDAIHNIHVGMKGRMCACAHLLEMDSWGDLMSQNIDEYQNSIKTRIFARSCLNGTFCFCNKHNCYYFTEYNKEVQMNHETLIREDIEEPDITWADLYFDQGCNLKCESCRNEIIVDQSVRTREITDRFIETVLPNIQFLQAAGMGEILFSPNYKRILEDDNFSKLKGVMFISNGNVRQLELWDEYIGKVNGNAFVGISIDATNAETYRLLRRGGSFSAVLDTLNKLSELKKKNKLKDFGISMVVQRKNYEQIVELSEMADRFGAGVVNYNHLVNMGSYTDSEWKELCMYDAQGNVVPEVKQLVDKISEKDNRYFFRNGRLYVYKLLGKSVIDGYYSCG